MLKAAVRFLIFCLIVAVGAHATAEPEPLPPLDIDATSQTVSGISSGGYMAVQMHVAFSSDIKGAGVIAAGPYHCANTGGWVRAINTCMIGLTKFQKFWCYIWPFSLSEECKDIGQLAIDIADARSGKEIDPVSNLAKHRVYVLAGGDDLKIIEPVVRSLANFYGHYIKAPEQVSYIVWPNMAHTFPTESYQGNDCDISETPNISDCDLDGAGKMLQHLYPGLRNPRTLAGEASSLVMFDQTEFFGPDKPQDFSMWPYGWVYIPQACRQAGNHCRLHVAFHGCKQTPEFIQDQFPVGTGYNRWAEENGIVVLYPQAAVSDRSNYSDHKYQNPEGCWDWWGYTDATNDSWDTKTGRQMAVVKRMMERLAQRPAPH